MTDPKRILAIAPHPDDETLGCGGTMLMERAAGARLFWLIVTDMTEAAGFSSERIATREQEITAVGAAYGVEKTFRLGFAAAMLDAVPKADIVAAIGRIVRQVQPTDVYLPFRRDGHSDHTAVFDAGAAATKWFRYPSVLRVLAYETPSETDFDLNPDSPGFRPNVFVDISSMIDQKLAIAQNFESEFGAHPFPRSFDGARALAIVRGAASGFHAAEAFMLLRERIPATRALGGENV